MRSVVRSWLEMFRRVRGFLASHLSLDPGFPGMMARIEDRLARAQAIEGRESAGRSAARGARAHRQELRRVLHSQLIRYLVAVGSVAAKGRTELTGRFRLPESHATNSAFISRVRELVALAETQRELLVEVGMRDDLLEKLTKMVAEFEATLESVRAARLEHIGARVELESLRFELSDSVKVVDGMVRYGFGDNPEVMAEWKAAKAVPAVRAKPAPPEPGTSTPGGIAPAA
jgi:hypothetical protein